LANIFLHYVLDEWFEREVRPTALVTRPDLAPCVQLLGARRLDRKL
jgi:hypothetical protein